MINRRYFLGAGLAAGAASLFPLAMAQQGTSGPTLPSPGFRRTRIGAMDVFAINDGVLRRPLGDEFVRNAPLDQVKELLSSQGLSTAHVDIPFTPFLIVSGANRVLIDTGFADNGPPTTGRLLENMAAAGFKPDDITHVVLSHYHGDHINGLRFKNGHLVYPRARVMVPAPEHAFWTDPARVANPPENLKGAIGAVRRALGDLPASQLVTFNPGDTIVPGITSIPAFGHTPGHTLFTATSEGKSFIYVADLTNVPALFARNPDWAVVFDMDAEMARQTRRKVFEMIVRERMIAGGFHFPFPAMGTIAASGQGYQFTPMA